MEITFVAGSLDHEGAGSNVSLDILSRNLIEYGHGVTILTLNIGNSNNLTYNPPYSVESLAECYDRDSWKGLLDAIRRHTSETDIIHVFDPFYIPILAAYRYFGGDTPVVARLNSYTLFCTNPSMMDGSCHRNCSVLDKIRHDNVDTNLKVKKTPQYLVSRFSTPRMVKSIDEFFAQSPCVKRIYTDTGIPEEQIRVLTNFYDPSFMDMDPDNTEFSRDDFNLLYVGRLIDIKGVDVLLEAIALADTDVTVDIIGDGPASSDLRSRAATLGIEDACSFHGWVEHEKLPAYYSESNVFVHPGRWFEPSGRALLEAMQYDCPAIVSDIGGPPWIVGDAGLTFPPEDSEELAAKIEAVTTDPQLYAGLKEDCRERLQNFSPDRIIRDIEERYRSLTL